MKKNSAFCSVLQGNPAVASPKEQLYEQMTSNPAFTERNIQKANAYLLYSRQEQKSLVTYHTLQSLYVYVWLVNTLTSTAPIRAPIICMWSRLDFPFSRVRSLILGMSAALFSRTAASNRAYMWSPADICEQWKRNLLYKYQWNTRWAFAPKLGVFTCENNVLSSHVKISPLLWLHNI